MLSLGLLILLPTAIIASNYGNYGSFQNPMRYNDNNHNREGVRPSNLIFNFEQLRRDQPPQIEMRDESLGLYMHRRPETTTTAAPIVVPEINHFPEVKPFEHNDPFSRFSNIPAHVNNYNQQSTPNYYSYPTNLVQSTPVYDPYRNMGPSTPMPSPPPAPKWSDFSEAFNKQVFPHYGSETVASKMPAVPEYINFQQPQHQPTGIVEKPFEKMPSAPVLNHFQRPQHQPTAPVKSPINHDIRRNPAPPARPHTITTPGYNTNDFGSMRKDIESRQRQNIANRGSHKFHWNDLVTEPSSNQRSQQVSSTSAPVVQGKNPPSIPTLTPWLDGFGK